uniref:Uncharacterized protein n=1 Tax=Cucumis melo TaxID=3656 RepID=A0A9I9DYZ6_CUCME
SEGLCWSGVGGTLGWSTVGGRLGLASAEQSEHSAGMCDGRIRRLVGRRQLGIRGRIGHRRLRVRRRIGRRWLRVHERIERLLFGVGGLTSAE